MQAASRQSLRAAQDLLDGFVDRSSADELDTVAGELFGVVGLLDAQRVLRRSLSDPAADEDARAGLLQRLLASRVGPRTLELLESMVRSRWSQPRDLPDAVEVLAEQAALAVAEPGGTLDDVEDELFRIGRLLAAQPELRALLSDGRAPADGRVRLLDRLVADKASPVTRRLLEQAVRAPRGRTLEEALEALVEMAAARRERYVAYVRSPVRLTAEQESRLGAVLSRIYGRAMDLQVEVAPELLGGLQVRVRDEVIDGSVLHRLEEARQRLTR